MFSSDVFPFAVQDHTTAVYMMLYSSWLMSHREFMAMYLPVPRATSLITPSLNTTGRQAVYRISLDVKRTQPSNCTVPRIKVFLLIRIPASKHMECAVAITVTHRFFVDLFSLHLATLKEVSYSQLN